MSQNDDNEHSNGNDNDNHQDNNDVSDLILIFFIVN